MSPESGSTSVTNPVLYVGTDGRLYGDILGFPQVVSTSAVDDGQWHSVALVSDYFGTGSLSLYVDGQLVGTTLVTYYGSGLYNPEGSFSFNQIGTGYTTTEEGTPGGWFGFAGEINDVAIWNVTRSASEVSQDTSAPLLATQVGLAAYYDFAADHGVTAPDLTPNHNNGTLSGPDGASGAAIELGGDGMTSNASSPGAGPNDLPSFPVVVETVGGTLKGWLGESLPDTSFRIDLFARRRLFHGRRRAGSGLSRLARGHDQQPRAGGL